MSASTNKLLRQALHSAEPPAKINARWFYTSAIGIDDPLSPLPPPNTSATPLKQEPKPFSEYDNTALDEAWHELRRKLARYHEEQEEKRETSQKRRESSRRRDESVASSRPNSSGARPVRSIASQEVDIASSLDTLSGTSPSQDTLSAPDTTGTPFLRAPSRKKIQTLSKLQRRDALDRSQKESQHSDTESFTGLQTPPSKAQQGADNDGPTTSTAVGVSRLHQVEMPGFDMTPIYWTPVNDSAPVVRGTWFYQDTMLPVEPQVATMLEAGYVDLRCWTDTWKDELNSAIEVGAAGEEKIVHLLWPEKPSNPTERRPGGRSLGQNGEGLLQIAASNLIEEEEADTPESLRQKAIDVASALIDIANKSSGHDNKASGSLLYGRGGTIRMYASSGVIYANEREARILKPSLMPSAYYGRRPLANYIRKGYKLGIPVVRGFDQTVWNKLHPSKTTVKSEMANKGVATSASGVQPYKRLRDDPVLAKAERPQVTDLILVIHGIGQKLSQRMESFHFTHAINAFRREINVEVSNKELKARFREDMGNIMVLPINWRHSLSFEEGGYKDGLEDPGINEFTLDDITPNTLPSIRNIVSDVMLDIPYYLSHHQPKMIAAVVQEANRVYQLWCQNNPGFSEFGRVHLIAHSLGSVMAVDVLSRQPTSIPDHLADPATIDLQATNLDHFLFNTANLFLAGSPAGFFLLLKRAQLLPRIDHPSAAAQHDLSINNISVCGERGQYGCIAVDNIYNIINPYDPVAYRMNAAVDAAFSASLKQATIPSATPGWFGVGTKSTAFYGKSYSASRGPNYQDDLAATSFMTTPSLPRLPSNVELEVHNFTREELAEKRMLLLNDNGQIDFFLRYGGGAFEIPYITMLGAHSSYWLLQDFVRLIVTETGREQGRQGTFLGMRAVKKKNTTTKAGRG